MGLEPVRRRRGRCGVGTVLVSRKNRVGLGRRIGTCVSLWCADRNRESLGLGLLNDRFCKWGLAPTFSFLFLLYYCAVRIPERKEECW